MQSWSHDANQYVADEDDLTYSCRVSGTKCSTDISFCLLGRLIKSAILFFFSNDAGELRVISLRRRKGGYKGEVKDQS